MHEHSQVVGEKGILKKKAQKRKDLPVIAGLGVGSALNRLIPLIRPGVGSVYNYKIQMKQSNSPGGM